MYKTTTGVPTPQANLAINKSRIKLYGKNSQDPTYYLKKGQEFEIELFNPTKDTIMAKISLNGKPIAQGGLVLKPGVRVFLDRYIDVARKFKFDTYEVGNSAEVKKAIEDNGDFKVEFFREQQPIVTTITTSNNWGLNDWDNYRGSLFNTTCDTINVGASGISNGTYTSNCGSVSNYSADIPVSANAACMDGLNFAPQELKRSATLNLKTLKKRVQAKAKTIETGRVEEGSKSNQTMEKVYMNWESFPFHTLEYKMLPVSQKINTVEDIQVKRYCSNCGNKQKPNFKFCPSCGSRV